jgi:hypothetical protein
VNPVRLRGISIAAGAALLITVLFVLQKPADEAQQDRFMRNLQHPKQLDAESDRDVLSSRYELPGSYHPKVRKAEEARRTKADLQCVPEFVRGRKREYIDKLLKTLSGVVPEKRRLIERFKSDNAVLKNSLRYFPVLIDEAQVEASKAATGDCTIILQVCCGMSSSTILLRIPISPTH